MPWKLIAFLVVLALVVVFAGFNINNASDISFGFYTIEGVPIFVSLFCAFLLGVIVTIPVAVRFRSRRKKKKPKEDKGALKESAPKESASNEKPLEEQTAPDESLPSS